MTGAQRIKKIQSRRLDENGDPLGWRWACPYWQAANGGPKDLVGAHGPGTCMGGCYSEPACMT